MSKVSKVDAFQKQCDPHLDALRELIGQVNEGGDTEETSQKLTLLNGLNQFEMALNGVQEEDLPDDFEFPIENLSLPYEPDY